MTVEFIIPPASVWTGNVRLMTASPRVVGQRVLHRSEGGFPTPDRMPNVRRGQDAPPVIFTPALQQLAWDVMKIGHPTLTRTQFESVFGSGAWGTNRNGLDTDHPKLMDGIIFAGHLLLEPIDRILYRGDWCLYSVPGVHAIDATKPLPSAQEVIERGWYMVSNTGQGPTSARHFAQGDGDPIYVIYALEEPARYLMNGVEEGISYTNFARWDSDRRPDPLRYGG